MIGNDIIDIAQTKVETNWRRKGFLQKVFTFAEQQLIKESTQSFQLVWRMWSMKESAYKIYLQKDKVRFFNPSKISCTILSPTKGTVCIDDLYMNTMTIIHSDYIFTSASLGDLDSIESNHFYLPNNEYAFQSALTHQKILDHVAKKEQLQKDKLEIKKTPTRVPKIFYEGVELTINFSLSHHGHYGAFSIVNKTNNQHDK